MNCQTSSVDINYHYIILRIITYIDHHGHETDQKSFVACILLALALSSMAASLATSTAALLAGCPSTRICPSPWGVPELVPKQGPLRVGRVGRLQGRDLHSARPHFGCKGQAFRWNTSRGNWLELVEVG